MDARELLPIEQYGEETVDAGVTVYPNNTPLLSKCRTASRLAGLVGICVGLAVLFGGWACDISILRTMVPDYSAMVPNTALSLLLCGVVLWLGHAEQFSRAKRLLSQVCAGIVGLIGLATLIQYLVGQDLGINGLLFSKAVMQVAPGRMAILSTAASILLGGALYLGHQRRGFAVGQYMVIAAGVMCLFNAIGYVYGIRSFYGLAFAAGSTSMAIHASLTFIILCAGALLSHPDWGVMSTITSPAPGGAMARRLLPAAGGRREPVCSMPPHRRSCLGP